MGQRQSRTSSESHGQDKTSRGKPTPSFLLMDFAALLLGNDLDKFEVSRLPTSFDELCDWAEDAETISRSAGATDPYALTRIEPLVSLRENEQCADLLPSLPPIEQARFFAESVVVKFDLNDGGGTRTLSRLLSVRDFAKYYTLVRRLSDLLALERLQCGAFDAPSPTQPTKLTECVICCDETSNSILPCNHRICESCERRWVRKQLVCPFCKTRFRSSNEVRNCAWHLPEFSEKELHSDLVELYSQIEQFWDSSAYNVVEKEEDINASYEPVGRLIKLSQNEDEDFVVSKA